MNINLTDITKNIGNTIAKIKNNNELITELNKAYNPTFTEILEDVKDSDPTLAALLMFWYNKKYSESDLDKLTTNIRKQFGLKDKVKKEVIATSVSSGGGCTDNDYYSSFIWNFRRNNCNFWNCPSIVNNNYGNRPVHQQFCRHSMGKKSFRRNKCGSCGNSCFGSLQIFKKIRKKYFWNNPSCAGFCPYLFF